MFFAQEAAQGADDHIGRSVHFCVNLTRCFVDNAWMLDFAYPVASCAQNKQLTIVDMGLRVATHTTRWSLCKIVARHNADDCLQGVDACYYIMRVVSSLLILLHCMYHFVHTGNPL